MGPERVPGRPAQERKWWRFSFKTKKNLGKTNDFMATGKTLPNNGTPLLEIAEEAVKTYEQALRRGLKLQQEAAKWWSKTLQQTDSAPDWQKRVADLTSTAQKQLEEVLALLERNNRCCVELAKKASEAAQTPGLPESQHKWLEFWKSSMTAAVSNAEALAAANAKIISSCIDLVEKSCRATDLLEAKAAS